MISISHPTANNTTHTRRNNHLQQVPANTNPNVTTDNFPVDVPRGWGLDLPSASAIDLLQTQFDDPTVIPTGLLPADAMQSDAAWGASLPQQYQSKIGRVKGHQRESSLSSLGSAGPASPFNHNTSNPQIAVTTDFGSDALDMAQAADANSANNNYIVKSLGSYPGYHNVDAAMPEMAYPGIIPQPANNGNQKNDRGLLPAPEFGNSSSRSQPTSVASSVGGDSPATPTVHEPEAAEKRRKGMLRKFQHTPWTADSFRESTAYSSVPKLDRTLTDIYSDELYNPNFAITSTTPPSQSQLALSPANDVFSQRLNAANSQHLSARQSPVMSDGSRERSPFRTSSPMVSAVQNFSVPPSATGRGMQFNSAQRVREENKVKQEAQLQQQMGGSNEPETPKTISPKDAILEFPQENDERNNFPLFPTEGHDFVDQFTKAMMPQPVHNPAQTSHQMNYMGPHMPTGLQIPQQYPFIPQANHSTPPRLSSGGSSMGSGMSTPINRGRPVGTGADSGTYTCTYHGCTLRFETPALLQKHKREGHRQAQGLGVARPHHDVGMTSSLIGSQAGPHRCNRINPSTGKPCNTVFSRPYDLTRHEDTIRNARKQKVNCDLCTEEKTFSRADALTRHYRVCHPEVEVPGKRRRG